MAENTSNKSTAWRRLLPALSFMSALLLLVVIFYDNSNSYTAHIIRKELKKTEITVPAKVRYNAAKDIFAELKNRKDIAPKIWIGLADEFYDIYAKYETWPNRPAALLRSAEVIEALATRFNDKDNFTIAANRYVKVAHEFKDSRLADDALLQAAIIHSSQLNDNEKALNLLKYIRSSLPKGDMYAAALNLEKRINQGIQVASKNRPEKEQKEAVHEVKAVDYAALTQVSWNTINKNTVQITIALNKNISWDIAKSKTKDEQIILSMKNTIPAKGVHKGARVKNSLLKQLAITHKQNITELKLDFANLKNYKTKIEKNPFRIILTAEAKPVQIPQTAVAENKPVKTEPVKTPAQKIETKPAPEEKKPSQPKAEQAVAQNKDASKTTIQQEIMEKSSVEIAQGATALKNSEPRITPKKEEQKDTKPELNAKELSSRVTKANTNNMALQLGLNVQTVFLDIGHGGRDPGAIGNGIVERELVFDISMRVGKILKTHDINVVYSRTSDVSVPLSTRPAKANDTRADLFVSIHVNANNDKRVQGFETYYLDFAKNSQDAQTAALENAMSDRKLGDMQNLLANVLLNVRTNESSDLANDVQRATIAHLKKNGYATKNGGTRSAPFHVLIGTNMPAILVEVGYCSNTREAERLKQSKYRDKLAQGIAYGIIAYKNRFEKGQNQQFALTNVNDDAI